MIMPAMVAGQSRAEEGQGAVRPVICAASVPAAEMACRMDPGMSVLEGSNVQDNLATYFGGAVVRGGGNEAGEAEDVFGAITGSGDGSGSIGSTQGRRRW